MDELKLEFNLPLIEFINDFTEEKLDPVEQGVFNEYLDSDPSVKSFAEKSFKGKESLSNAYQVTAADNFEEKLAQRIAYEKVKKLKKQDIL